MRVLFYWIAFGVRVCRLECFGLYVYRVCVSMSRCMQVFILQGDNGDARRRMLKRLAILISDARRAVRGPDRKRFVHTCVCAFEQ